MYKNSNYNIFISIMIVWSLFMCFMSFTISVDVSAYAVGWIHAYDNSFFIGNLYTADDMISPRLFINLIYSGFMRLNGGNWLSVLVVMLFLNMVVRTIGTVRIVMQICDKNSPVYSAIFALLFASGVYPSLATFLVFDTVNPAGLALGASFAVLSLSFVVGKEKNFNLAWFFVAIAALVHVHEGMYAFITIFILFLAHLFNTKAFAIKDHWCIFLSVTTILGVTVPSLLTDKLFISNQEFVDIYAIFRHPHHMVPSTWGIQNIISCFLVILFMALFRIEQLYFNEKKNIKPFMVEAILFILAWLGALGITYLFTEIIPIAAIPTMTLPKFFKYVVIVSMIWCLKTIYAYFQAKQYIAGFTLIFFLFFYQLLSLKYEIALFALGGLLIYFVEKNGKLKKWSELYSVMFAGVCLMVVLSGIIPQLSSVRLKLVFIVIYFLFVTILWYKKTGTKYSAVVMYTLSVFMLIISTLSNVVKLSNNQIDIITPKDLLIVSCSEDIYELASEFENSSEKTDVYLADPYDTYRAGWFQILSKRNCYVLYKAVPSSKSTIKEWYERLQQTNGLFDKEAVEIINIMKGADIQYILVNQKNYEKIDSSKDLEVYLASISDSYRIYRLTNQ